jgi:hypothetical protein
MLRYICRDQIDIKLALFLNNLEKGYMDVRIKGRGVQMSRKTINSTVITVNQNIKLWYRYMRFICSIKNIDMLEAIEQFGYRYKKLFSKKAMRGIK